ncbi:MAG: hypothetical protein IKL52_01265, partial [Candidatus Gastranaerophilales bacterium]|nr:hypothetical protein [Candidatus Gastranaerophilales bacterium]
MSETVLKGGISYTEGEIEYIWHTEEGACEKCQALNGLKFKNTDEIPDKPHPNCRCWIEAVDGNHISIISDIRMSSKHFHPFI